MSTQTLIEPTTSAVDSKIPGFNVSRETPVTVSADALATTEEVDIYYRANHKAEWKLAVDNTGTAITLTAAAYQIVLIGVGEYYVHKDATASDCGVYAAW